jgi:hypothetical protein
MSLVVFAPYIGADIYIITLIKGETYTNGCGRLWFMCGIATDR